MALNSLTLGFYLIYFFIVKAIIDRFFPDIEHKSVIRTLLMIIPLALRHFYNFIKNKNLIKMTPKARKLYSLVNKVKLDDLKNFISKEYSSVKEIENEYYMTGSNILLMAVQEDNLDLIKFLLSNGYNVNQRDKKNGETALIRAIHFNKLEIVKELLKYKPDFNLFHNEMKIKPINVAVMRNKNLIVDLLLMNGAVFDYNDYSKSYANQYMDWKNVKKEVKGVIAKHKCKYFI